MADLVLQETLGCNEAITRNFWRENLTEVMKKHPGSAKRATMEFEYVLEFLTWSCLRSAELKKFWFFLDVGMVGNTDLIRHQNTYVLRMHADLLLMFCGLFPERFSGRHIAPVDYYERLGSNFYYKAFEKAPPKSRMTLLFMSNSFGYWRLSLNLLRQYLSEREMDRYVLKN